jgi:hypothetical protein
MNTSTHHHTQRSTTEPTVEIRTERAERPAQLAQERPQRLLGTYLRLRPIQAATQKARDLHQLARAGESEWTPWIAIAALILFFAAIGLLMFGIVEAASQLLASASS